MSIFLLIKEPTTFIVWHSHHSQQCSGFSCVKCKVQNAGDPGTSALFDMCHDLFKVLMGTQDRWLNICLEGGTICYGVITALNDDIGGGGGGGVTPDDVS